MLWLNDRIFQDRLTKPKNPKQNNNLKKYICQKHIIVKLQKTKEKGRNVTAAIENR